MEKVKIRNKAVVVQNGKFRSWPILCANVDHVFETDKIAKREGNGLWLLKSEEFGEFYVHQENVLSVEK